MEYAFRDEVRRLLRGSISTQLVFTDAYKTVASRTFTARETVRQRSPAFGVLRNRMMWLLGSLSDNVQDSTEGTL